MEKILGTHNLKYYKFDDFINSKGFELVEKDIREEYNDRMPNAFIHHINATIKKNEKEYKIKALFYDLSSYDDYEHPYCKIEGI